ncbi:hypothetical protein HK096_010683, partial [Nowakowskiella sp. JEL0078]
MESQKPNIPLFTDLRKDSLDVVCEPQTSDEIISQLKARITYLEAERDKYAKKIAKLNQDRLKSMEQERDFSRAQFKRLQEVNSYLQDRIVSVIAYEKHLQELSLKYDNKTLENRLLSNVSESMHNLKESKPILSMRKPSILDINPDKQSIGNFVDSQIPYIEDIQSSELLQQPELAQSGESEEEMFDAINQIIEFQILSSESTSRIDKGAKIPQIVVPKENLNSLIRKLPSSNIVEKTEGKLSQHASNFEGINSVSMHSTYNEFDYNVLKNFPVFSEFPEKILEMISESWFEVSKKPGQLVIREEEVGSEIYFILEGAISFLHDNKEITSLGKGQFFGELGF